MLFRSRTTSTYLRIGIGLCSLFLSLPASAYDPVNKPPLPAAETPNELKDIGIQEHLGEVLDPNLEFTTDDGRTVKIGEYFSHPAKPTILSIVYYSCPNLCNYHLNGMTAALKQMPWTVGDQFDIVAVSMDHKETPDLAAKKKASYVAEYGRPQSAKGWHFLVGSEENVKKLTDAIGFKFRWDEKEKQYAHAAAATIVTPGGKLSRYLYGIEFDPKTVRLSLLEASNGKIGSMVDQLIMFCFHFDPTKNKYTLYAYNIMKISGLLMILALALILVPTWLRERRKRT